MADVYTRIGYIKGATGATGAQGAKGDTGDAATIAVGTVTTVPYGQTANVVNSGTSGAAVFDFTIPQGRPGQETTDMQNLVIGAITTSSASFPVPAVGETGKVLWGKVVKWFSDMSALVATKLDIASVVNDQTVTQSGFAMDARQANPNIANSLGAQITQRTRIYKSFADLGINLQSLTLFQVLERMEGGSVLQGSFTTSQITNLKTNGDLFVWKAAGDSVIQKSIIILNSATQSATGINTYIGFMRYDNHAVIWYTPSLTVAS